MDVSKLRSGEDVDTVLVCNDYCDTAILNCEDEAMCNDQVSHPPPSKSWLLRVALFAYLVKY